MSKTEIVKSLNDCGPQLQILQSLRELQSQGQSLSQELQAQRKRLASEASKMQEQSEVLSQDMKALPQAVASELAPILEEIKRLSPEIDQSMEAQRQTIADISAHHADVLMKQLKKIEEQREGISTQLVELSSALLRLDGQQEEAKKVSVVMQNTPDQIAKAMEEWKQYEMQKKPWRLVVISATLAAILAVCLNQLGQIAFENMNKDKEMQTDAMAMRQLWNNASQKERDLVQEILKRSKK